MPSASFPTCPAATRCSRETRSRVMMSPNEAVPAHQLGDARRRRIVRDHVDVRRGEREIDQHHAATCGKACARARWRTAWCRRRGRRRSRRCCARRLPPAAAKPQSRRCWFPPREPVAAAAAHWRRPATGRWCGCAHAWIARPALASATGTADLSRHRRGVDLQRRGARALAAQQRAGHHERRGQAERAERRDQHDRHLLREERDVRHHRARDDARVGGRRRDAVARGRLAVFGEIGFEQIALRLGLALQRAQLHVLVAGRGGLALELVERRAQSVSSRAPATLASFSSERASRSPSERICWSRSAICARISLMRGCCGKQRRGLLGELRAQGHALLGQPADQFGIGDVGAFDRLPGARAPRGSAGRAPRNRPSARAPPTPGCSGR